MKWLKSLVLASTILVFAWGAHAAKFYEQATALNRMTWKLDSLLTAVLNPSPTPVSVSEHVLFSGITMESGVQGSTTNLNMVAGGDAYRTFPITAAPCVDGAKALYLVLSWTNFEHGYFSVKHKFGPSATDTLFGYFSENVDTVAVSDSLFTFAGLIPADAAGSVVLRIPDVPGAGYYSCKITARDKVHTNWITGLQGTLVVVQ